MAVDKYTQEERVFIQKAVMSGFSMDEINNSIKNKRAKQSFWGKIAENKYLPAIPATIAAGIGFLAAGPAGAAYGGAGGWGLGEMIRQEAANQRGLSYGEEPLSGEEARKQTGQQALRAGGAGTLAYTLGQLFNMTKAVATPKKTTGKMREKSLEGKTTSTATLEEEVLANLEKDRVFQQSTPEVQKQARERAANLLRTTNPLNLSGEGAGTTINQNKSTDLNEIYKNLSAFEKSGRAYESTSKEALADKLVSGSVRNYLNTIIPQKTTVLNKALSTMSKIEPYAQRAKYGAVGAGGAALGWGLFGNKIKNILGIGGE